ncbi:MAG: hypothetical protein K8H88_05115, partial [Sandaracinaceae bacterium]|nr:hypothetical protein [Sandaracinaceae bacterium]
MRTLVPIAALAAYVVVPIFAALLGGCGSAPRARVASAVDRGDLEGAMQAYERLRESDGDDRALLGRVAGLVLEA